VWALAEFHGVIHRRLREGSLSPEDAHELSSRFDQHVQEGLWKLIPVHEILLRRTSALIVSAPPDLLIRTADAVHQTTAHEAGERDVWTSDRHMLASAAHFGLTGRSV
jgi:predicted nucleic acid-binding protein